MDKSPNSGVRRHLGSKLSPATDQLCDEHMISPLGASISSSVNGVHYDGSTS